MCWASVGHVTPHVGAEFVACLSKPCVDVLKGYAHSMKNNQPISAVVSPILALYLFVIGVLVSSATLRV